MQGPTIRLLLAFLLMIQLPAAGQEGFYLGFSGNFNASMLLNQNTYGVKWNVPGNRKFELAYKGTAGYGGGLKFGYNFRDQFGLEWQTGYQAMGMRYEDTDPNDVIHRKAIDIDYVTIGMAFRYTSIFARNRYKQEQKVRLAVVVGPQIGILTRAGLSYTLDAEPLDLFFDDGSVDYPNQFTLYNEAYYDVNIDDDKDFFSNVDAGLLVQVGVDIYPKPWFYISPVVSGYLGFTDINASDFRDHEGYGSTRNAYFGVNLSMGFYIREKGED